MPRIVLVVDDTNSSADTLTLALIPITSLEVRSVSSAREALEVLASGIDVAALITDLHMPIVDGFELIAEVRSRPQFHKLLILVISGDGNSSTPARLRELGANAFFSKPFSPSEVRCQLEKLLDAC